MTGKLALMLTVAALLILCGCSSYEVTSSGDPAPLPPADGISLDVEVAFGRDNTDTQVLVKFNVPEAGWVRLEVLSATGYRVRLLVDREMAMGFETVDWDARNDHGDEVASGIYIYRLEVGGEYFARSALLCHSEGDCEKLTGEN